MCGPLKPMYSYGELAHALGVHETTIGRWLKAAGVSCELDGLRLRRVPASELKAKCAVLWESLIAAQRAA